MIGPSVVVAAVLSLSSVQVEDPWLEAALETASWLEGVGVRTEHGKSWPVQIEGEARFSLGLYDGAPGVVLFFLEAHARTGRAAYLDEARAGADDLLARLALALERDETLEAGLYTGLSGVGFTLCEAWKATGDDRYLEAANRIVSTLQERAVESEHGVHWNGVTDIISGSAGIGLFLLYAGRELEREDAVNLARRAADHLLHAGRPAASGTSWPMSAEFPRTMPNFSHGTAGVGYFLVQVARVTERPEYLRSAESGASYLRNIAREREAGGKLVFHSEPGNEELFYLSWCHGPPGTTRFLILLERATGDEAWGTLADELVQGLAASGVPRRSPGLWNNAGLCCGDAGIADWLLALEAERLDQLEARLLASILERSTVDEQGRRWTVAEHRVRPEQLSTQTGLMQGAAGIGLVLLRVSAAQAGQERSIRLPDEPW